MLTRGLRVDVEFNLPSSQTVAFNMNVLLNLVCLNATLDTLAAMHIGEMRADSDITHPSGTSFSQLHRFFPISGCLGNQQCPRKKSALTTAESSLELSLQVFYKNSTRKTGVVRQTQGRAKSMASRRCVQWLKGRHAQAQGAFSEKRARPREKIRSNYGRRWPIWRGSLPHHPLRTMMCPPGPSL